MSRRHRRPAPAAPAATSAPAPGPQVDQPHGNGSLADMIMAQLPPTIRKMVEPEPEKKRAAPRGRRKPSPATLPRIASAVPTLNTAAKAGQAVATGGAYGKQPGIGPTGGLAARSISAAGGAIKTGKGLYQIGSGVAEGDTLKAVNGFANTAGGGAAVMASAGAGGPAAPMLAAGIGLAQRGEEYSRKLFNGRTWSDKAADAGSDTRTAVTEALGNETAGDIAGGIATVGAGMLYGVGALATGAVGLGEDVYDGAAAVVNGFSDLAESARQSQHKRRPACPGTVKRDHWDEATQRWVPKPKASPEWSKPLPAPTMAPPVDASPRLGSPDPNRDAMIDAVNAWVANNGKK